MPKKVTIYLASQSPRRRQLIRRAGHSCRVIPSAYKEIHEPRARPRSLVLKHARGKLTDSAAPPSARFVVAADTIVVYRNRIYGKPSNISHAIQMLNRLSGKTHQVFTGWTLQDRLRNKCYERCVRSSVRIKKLTPTEIKNYFKRMNPLDKAGSYAVQSRPSVVEAIQGSYTNVMGFPLEDFKKILSVCLRIKK